MRGTRALFATLGAVAAVGLFASSGVLATAATNTNPKDLEISLQSLAAGAQTLGGPGNFTDGANQSKRVYEVLTGPTPDVCITVRNLSAGQIEINATGATKVEVGVNRTRTACYGAPTQIILNCDQRACSGVWRVDRQS